MCAAKQITNNKTSDLFKSRKNILAHLERQDYVVDDYTNFSFLDINAMYLNNQMDMLVTHKTNKKKVYVKYYLETKIRPANLDLIIEDLFVGADTEDGIADAPALSKDDTLVLILGDEPNDKFIEKLKYIYENKADGYFVVPIAISRLLFNIFDSKLVPPHYILTEQEVADIRARYNVRADVPLKKIFPEVSRWDPVSLMLFLKPGQVVKIMRDSTNSVKSVFYRVCI